MVGEMHGDCAHTKVKRALAVFRFCYLACAKNITKSFLVKNYKCITMRVCNHNLWRNRYRCKVLLFGTICNFG